jgi:hypothetical protein
MFANQQLPPAMKSALQIHLSDVPAVYAGPEVMIEKQLTYDALKIIAFDGALAQGLVAEMRFMHSLAKAGKIIQGLIVARKD